MPNLLGKRVYFKRVAKFFERQHLKDIVMIISIDPGINNCGISILDIDDNFRVVLTSLVKNARKFTDDEKIIEAKCGNRAVKILAILNRVKEYLKEYRVTSIILEAPFYNALTPMAYGSILEVIFSIKYDIILKYNLDFKLIEPLLVKKLFTNKSLASKELIKQFLITKKENKDILMDIDVESISEHEIDAIAIGYVHYLNLKEASQTDKGV